MSFARTATVAAAIGALLLSACATRPPEGILPPEASETQTADAVRGTTIRLPPDRRLVAMRVVVNDPPPELLDEQGAGVVTVRRVSDREPIHLVFVNNALSVHALKSGAYRVESIAGFDCGTFDLPVALSDAPLALGTLTLDIYDETEAALLGNVPTPDELTGIAGLLDTEAAAVESDPLERGAGISCVRDTLAVSRPDVDPTIRKLTPLEIAGGIFFAGLIGGALAASSSFVFISGPAGALLLIGL